MNSRRDTWQISKISKSETRKSKIAKSRSLIPLVFIYIFVRKVYNVNAIYFHIIQANYFAIKGVTNMKNINDRSSGGSGRMGGNTKAIKNDNDPEITEKDNDLQNDHSTIDQTGNDKEATFIEFRFTDFRIFPIVMKDENICRKFLELVLGKKIGAIRIYDDEDRVLDITSEKSILIAPHLRGVRLDVFVAEENAWYDIEMQCQTEPELPKRSRLYQAEIDVENIASGAGYSELKPSYIIFICMFDPFGKGQAVYRFWYREDSMHDLKLGDETCKIFLNITCPDEVIPEELKGFFHYVRDMDIQERDELVSAIHHKVEILNSRDRRSQMHTLEQYINEQAQRSRIEGEKTGRIETERDIARKMLAKKLDIRLIKEITGLTEEEIKKL